MRERVNYCITRKTEQFPDGPMLISESESRQRASPCLIREHPVGSCVALKCPKNGPNAGRHWHVALCVAALPFPNMDIAHRCSLYSFKMNIRLLQCQRLTYPKAVDLIRLGGGQRRELQKAGQLEVIELDS